MLSSAESSSLDSLKNILDEATNFGYSLAKKCDTYRSSKEFMEQLNLITKKIYVIACEFE